MLGMKKRGQVEKLSGFAMTIGVFAVIIAVVFVIMSNLASNPTLVSVGSRLDSNSVATVNGTAAYFADADSRGEAALGCSSVKIYNGSEATDVTGYFVISGCSATLISTNLTLSASVKQFNYTMSFNEYSYAANSTFANQTALYGIVGWIPIVVVAFIGGLVLFLVIRKFGNK